MKTQYLLARIGNSDIAVPALLVDSIAVMSTMVPVYRTAPHVVGLFALRSRVVTVIDVQLALGMQPSTIAPYQRVIIVEKNGHAYALLVDEIEDISTIPEAEYRRAIPQSWRQMTESIVNSHGKPMLVLDLDRLLASPDKRRVA